MTINRTSIRTMAEVDILWRDRPRPADPRDVARTLANNPKPVAIVATCNRFFVAGEPAVVGRSYTIDAATAAGLVAVGKARLP